MELAINNGCVIDPANRIFSRLNLGIDNGRISFISRELLSADKVIDAKGLYVVPGFIDAHMHEGPFSEESEQFDIGIFECMLRMGVTTAIGGNCGSGPVNPERYLEAVDRYGLPVNFALLVPHSELRTKVGAINKYEYVSEEQALGMRLLAEKYLDIGCIGISFGIRYIPGITEEELILVSRAVVGKGKLISAHIRDDAANVISSAEELINIGNKLNIPIQVSHIGSMGAYGQMNQFLSLIDYHSTRGIDIWSDCYPYNAFSTGIGETTYDSGFLDRYGTNYNSIEVAEGKYKGQRCNKELFEELRLNYPDLITIGHVMREEEVDIAIAHPKVLIGSDGFMHNLQGHPRASGTFPRVICKYVKEKQVINLTQAIEKMTFLTASRYGLSKGNLGLGNDADIVVFDYEAIRDNATFQQPTIPPDGINYVIVNGEIAVHKNNTINRKLGRAIRK